MNFCCIFDFLYIFSCTPPSFGWLLCWPASWLFWDLFCLWHDNFFTIPCFISIQGLFLELPPWSPQHKQTIAGTQEMGEAVKTPCSNVCNICVGYLSLTHICSIVMYIKSCTVRDMTYGKQDIGMLSDGWSLVCDILIFLRLVVWCCRIRSSKDTEVE